jgi:NAD-dependent DNA ligase
MRIVHPTHCPSCDSELIQKNSILYCVNKVCPGQGAKLIENFAKVLKIKGLGPATIDKLNLTSIEDVYSLTLEDLNSILGKALGTKLYEQIDISKSASLNDLLPALGIPLIGKTASDKICSAIDSLEDASEETLKDIIGPKALSNLLDWLEVEEWGLLPFSFKSIKQPVITGETVCITGKLKSFKTKADAAKYLGDKGYRVVDSITKTTNILVNESGIESDKTKKARANGTKIVNNIMEL